MSALDDARAALTKLTAAEKQQILRELGCVCAEAAAIAVRAVVRSPVFVASALLGGLFGLALATANTPATPEKTNK